MLEYYKSVHRLSPRDVKDLNQWGAFKTVVTETAKQNGGKLFPELLIVDEASRAISVKGMAGDMTPKRLWQIIKSRLLVEVADELNAELIKVYVGKSRYRYPLFGFYSDELNAGLTDSEIADLRIARVQEQINDFVQIGGRLFRTIKKQKKSKALPNSVKELKKKLEPVAEVLLDGLSTAKDAQQRLVNKKEKAEASEAGRLLATRRKKKK